MRGRALIVLALMPVIYLTLWVMYSLGYKAQAIVGGIFAVMFTFSFIKTIVDPR